MSYQIGPGRTREDACEGCGNRVFVFTLVEPAKNAYGEEVACPLGVTCKQCGRFHPLRLGNGRSR